MPFISNCDALNRFHEALSSVEKPSHLQILVRDAMESVIQNCNLFNGCITNETPFFAEFFDCINSQDVNKVDDESCFSMLECLTIFFREKRLRFGLSKLTKSESSILNFFETSGHWGADEYTMVSHWYWHVLPKKVMYESISATH